MKIKTTFRCCIFGNWLGLTGLISLSSIANIGNAEPLEFNHQLSNAAIERTSHSVIYNGAYRKLDYPGGDVPAMFGVCTDVVVRAYRAVGVDLQKEVHEDMKSNFSKYPNNWGLKGTDTNIDHRRVPNLQTFFTRRGQSLVKSQNPNDYISGDIVSWILPNNLPHIGIVVDQRSSDKERPLIVHNIGRGPKMDDILFEYTITGHYRFFGSN